MIPYGERGFGINLKPLPLLAAAVGGHSRGGGRATSGVSDEIGGMGALLREVHRADADRRGRGAIPDPARQGRG